jgi:hypothetical protein
MTATRDASTGSGPIRDRFLILFGSSRAVVTLPRVIPVYPCGLGGHGSAPRGQTFLVRGSVGNEGAQHQDPRPARGRLVHGEQVELPRSQVHEQAGAGQLAAVPLERAPRMSVSRQLRPGRSGQPSGMRAWAGCSDKCPHIVPIDRRQQAVVPVGQVTIWRLIRAPGQEHRWPHPAALELSFVPQGRTGPFRSPPSDLVAASSKPVSQPLRDPPGRVAGRGAGAILSGHRRALFGAVRRWPQELAAVVVGVEACRAVRTP